jgi:hypothetical protein
MTPFECIASQCGTSAGDCGCAAKLRAEIERLTAELALERRRLAISEEALRRALEINTTLEGMLGEMNIAVPEEQKP